MPASAKVTERGSDGIAFEAPIPATQPGDTFPAGAILMWPYTSVPSGWARADGSAVARASYPSMAALAAADGYPDGAGDGVNTFNLPNYTDRMPIGAGNLYARAATGGAATVALAIAEMPTHNHGGATDAQSPSTGTESNDHTHQMSNDFIANSFIAPTGFIQGGSGSFVQHLNAPSTGGRSAVHTHVVNSHAHNISSQGSGTAHNNLPPYRACYFIVRIY